MGAGIPSPSDCCSECGATSTTNIPGPQGSAGANGSNGADGQNAYTFLTAGFTMPAEQANVVLAVVHSSWTTVGAILFVQSAGFFRVTGLPGATSITAKNLRNAATGDYLVNTGSGIAIPNSMTVVAAGVQGPTGPTGAAGAAGSAGATGATGADGDTGHDAVTHLTAAFSMPAQGANVTVDVEFGFWCSIGQVVFVQNAGYMQVVLTNPTALTLKNISNATEYTDNAAPGTTIPSTSGVSASGLQGPAGNTGSPPLVIVSNAQAQGTDGTAIVANTWQDVVLNLKNVDTDSICTLSTNTLALPAGSYRIRGAAPAYKGGSTVLRLVNITASTNVTGKPELGGDIDVQVNATMDTQLVLTVPSVIKFQQLCNQTYTGGKLGKAANITGVDEKFARFVIEQEL